MLTGADPALDGPVILFQDVIVLGPPAQKGVPSYKVVVEGDDSKVEV
jgi:hypothetical protein